MSTVVGVFRSQEQAERAVSELRDGGFTEEEISILARRGEQTGDGEDEEAQGRGMRMGTGEDVSEGAAAGGVLGGAAGLLAGAGTLAIPGIGPIVALGPIAAALTGAVAGGIAGSLIDLGIPEERGRHYEQQVRQGQILAVVQTEKAKGEEAADMLRRHGAMDVEVH